MFAQIAAERLGVAVDEVAVEFGDSAPCRPAPARSRAARWRWGGRRSRSRSTGCGRSACASARGCSASRSATAALGGRAADAPAGGRCRCATIAAADATVEGERALRVGARLRRRAPTPPWSRSSAPPGVCGCCRIAAVDDAGTIINPLLAEGQVIGGTAQGLGECLGRGGDLRRGGAAHDRSFLDYSLLTAAEMPPVAAAFVESPSPLNPLGAKGIGEGGAIGTPAAVANAVADALGGAAWTRRYRREALIAVKLHERFEWPPRSTGPGRCCSTCRGGERASGRRAGAGPRVTPTAAR